MNATYLVTEIRRNFRAPRFLIFVVAFPVLMFLLQANVFTKSSDPDHVQIAAVIMINMMTFGAFAAATNSGARLALERAAGWQRQLRLTPLTGTGYLAYKGISGLLVGLPALILVPVLAVAVEGVHLDAVEAGAHLHAASGSARSRWCCSGCCSASSARPTRCSRST